MAEAQQSTFRRLLDSGTQVLSSLPRLGLIAQPPACPLADLVLVVMIGQMIMETNTILPDLESTTLGLGLV
jgi:hypothetical protein